MNLDCDKLADRQKLVLEIIVRIVKLQKRFNNEFDKDFELGFEISASVTKALTTFRTIEEGGKFTQFMNSLKMQELLTSTADAHKIAHLACNYRTDDCKYETGFKKTVKATKNLVIKIDEYTSTDLI